MCQIVPSLIKTIFVSQSYQVREKHLFYGSLPALGIGVASFWSVSGKRYSGKPDGAAGTPKDHS